MRTFIAIDFPEEINDYVLQIQNRLKDVTGLSVAKHFHLTLKFLGEISEEKAAELKRLLQDIKFNAFKSSLTEIGCFPNSNYIRVVWVGMQEHPVIELNSMIEEKLYKAGFRKEKFTPHITLARVKYLADKSSFLKMLAHIVVEKKEFEISEFKLKKSTLTPKEPIYEDLAVFKLE